MPFYSFYCLSSRWLIKSCQKAHAMSFTWVQLILQQIRRLRSKNLCVRLVLVVSSMRAKRETWLSQWRWTNGWHRKLVLDAVADSIYAQNDIDSKFAVTAFKIRIWCCHAVGQRRKAGIYSGMKQRMWVLICLNSKETFTFIWCFCYFFLNCFVLFHSVLTLEERWPAD